MTADELDRRAASHPPRLATWLASLRMPPADREFQLGDLAEEYRMVVVPDFGERAGRRWYWRQALRCLFTRRSSGGVQPPSREPVGRSAWAGDLARDIRHALRLMRLTPLATTASVLTLALGIGANAAMVSVAKPVLLDPLPVSNEDALATIWLTYPTSTGGTARNPVSAGDYDAMRGAPAFERVEAFARFPAVRNLVAGGEPRLVTIGSVTAGFFSALGIQPVVGRTLLPSDDATDANPIVMTEALWRSAFGADPAVAGRPVHLDGTAYVVVGVVPDWSGIGTRPADAWVLLDLETHIRQRLRAYYLGVIGRLRADASLEAANEQLATIMARLVTLYPESNGNPPIGALAVSFREELTGPVRTTFLVLVGGAAMVLVIAGINLAGLHLVRQAGRRRELAVRHAVGASRGRLGRLLMIDSIVQSMAGGLVGLIAALVTLAALRSMAPEGNWYQIPVRPPLPVALLAVGLAVVVGAIVGLVPAVRAASISGLSAVRSRVGLAERTGSAGRTVLVAAQVALTLMLLIVATLVGASLGRVLGVDPGFRTDGILVADFTLPGDRYPNADARTRFYDALVERLETTPGTGRACVASDVPLADEVGGMTWVVDGHPTGQMVGSVPKVVSPGCFEVLGVPVLSGQLFDSGAPRRELVISQSMARTLWPAEPADFSPVGRRLRMGTPDGWLWTVVGMVGDIRNTSLESSYARQVWIPHSSGLWPPDRLLVRGSGRPAQLAPAVRAAMTDLAPTVALANVRTMDQVVAGATASRRFVLVLLAGFGTIALLLSAVGIYGVLAHSVEQRTSEIGLRMALGARGADVARLIAGRLAIGVLGGGLLGTAAAWAASTWVASLLYQTSATDIRVYASAGAFVALMGCAAAWLPTRRAVRIDPLGALRQE
ncbi:MAG TPA: ADOP family duplicated permease [Vicinamibacterales bacterium]|nr:ADOP family duplicated permease [Vicinamibacterales bacterium]